jgi:hypothetical protein
MGETRRNRLFAGQQWNREARPARDILGHTAGRRVGQKAVIRVGLLDMPTARSCQLIEQRLCVL